MDLSKVIFGFLLVIGGVFYLIWAIKNPRKEDLYAQNFKGYFGGFGTIILGIVLILDGFKLLK